MRLAHILLPVLLYGCAPTTAPDTGVPEGRVRVLGTIDHGRGPEITVIAGGSVVPVAITTYGPGCYIKGSTEVEVGRSEAVVTPYNYAPLPGQPCTRDLRPYVHTATIHFSGSGTVRVLVRGLSTATNPYGDTITVERIAAVP